MRNGKEQRAGIYCHQPTLQGRLSVTALCSIAVIAVETIAHLQFSFFQVPF